MQKNVLGRTDIEISRLGLGSLFVKSDSQTRERAVETIHRAIELGINYIDTAPGYGDSETVVGTAIKGIGSPLYLSTKLGGFPEPFDPRNKSCLMQSIESSLKLLGRSQIDLLLIHEPDRPGQYDWWTDFKNVEGPVLELINELKEKGLIKYAGLGGTTVYEMTHLVRSNKFDVVLTAFNYSLLWREAEKSLFPEAQKRNIGIISGSPLQQGVFARDYKDFLKENPPWLSPQRAEQLGKLYNLVEETGIPLPEMALRFVYSSTAIDCVLTGSGSVAEVEANVAAVENGPLPSDVLNQLNEIAAILPCRPYEEPFGLGWYMSNPNNYKGPGEPC